MTFLLRKKPRPGYHITQIASVKRDQFEPECDYGRSTNNLFEINVFEVRVSNSSDTEQILTISN